LHSSPLPLLPRLKPSKPMLLLNNRKPLDLKCSMNKMSRSKLLMNQMKIVNLTMIFKKTVMMKMTLTLMNMKKRRPRRWWRRPRRLLRHTRKPSSISRNSWRRQRPLRPRKLLRRLFITKRNRLRRSRRSSRRSSRKLRLRPRHIRNMSFTRRSHLVSTNYQRTTSTPRSQSRKVEISAQLDSTKYSEISDQRKQLEEERTRERHSQNGPSYAQTTRNDWYLFIIKTL